MPSPTYLDTVNGVDALVLSDLGGGDFLFIDWDQVGDPQQTILLDGIFDKVDEVSAITAADGTGPFPGFQMIRHLVGTVGGDATGLEALRTYNFSVDVDGTPLSGTFLGSDAATYTTLLSEIQTILGGAATISLISGGSFDGWILIESATTGTGSSVVINQTSTDALTKTVAAQGIERTINGGANLFDVSELSFHSTNNNWQEQFRVSAFGPSFPTASGFRLQTFTLATLPTNLGFGGELIFVSNATGASLTGSLCFSNGTVWIDVTTHVAVA